MADQLHTDAPLLCLSVRQPWPWLILHAGKDIENRTWSTNVRGKVLLHASKGLTVSEWMDAWKFARTMMLLPETVLAARGLSQTTIERGGIVGSVDIVDCVSQSTSPWFQGPFGFVLANAKPLPFIPCTGRLGFFPAPDHVMERLRHG